MRKIIVWFMMLAFVLSLAACAAPAGDAGEPSTVPKPQETSTPSEPEKTVAFVDPVLEKMVRASMGRPEGSITLAEAEAVTRLCLSFEWQQYISKETPIRDIGGLEYFKNLESLDLSYHAITDIVPLAGLTKLTTLSLGSNPVTDVAPLSGLTNLKGLNLSGCAAQDYGALSHLTALECLMLNNSSITDASPIANLTSLKRLYLDGCALDYSPLTDMVSNLMDCDFVITPVPSTLSELGFIMDWPYALFSGETADVRINHSEWGAPAELGAENCVRTGFGAGGYKADIGYYPEHDTYVVLGNKDGAFVLNYLYFPADGSVSDIDREKAEAHVRAIFPDASGDVLLAPIEFFNNTLEEELGMTADALFALPFEPPTLRSLGFIADEGIASYLYEQHEPFYFTAEVHNPEWGSWESGGDVRIFTPLSDEYRVFASYFADDKKYLVGADDNFGSGASFAFFADREEHIDFWCGTEGMTVEEYFINACNDPAIDDIYHYSIALVEGILGDTFGMSIDELYALPTS